MILGEKTVRTSSIGKKVGKWNESKGTELHGIV